MSWQIRTSYELSARWISGDTVQYSVVMVTANISCIENGNVEAAKCREMIPDPTSTYV